MMKICAVATIICASLLSAHLLAKTRSVGEIDIHYSVLASIDLPPSVAKQYKITRGGRNALLNIAFRHRATDRALAAHIEGTHSDLIHRHPLKFREIRAGNAIYYLSEFNFTPREKIYFRLTVRINGKLNDTFTFQHALFPEG